MNKMHEFIKMERQLEEGRVIFGKLFRSYTINVQIRESRINVSSMYNVRAAGDKSAANLDGHHNLKTVSRELLRY